MEIKEGMYARIDNDFRTICLGIGKIKKIVEDAVYIETTKDFFNGMLVSYNKNQIEKASYNLIDLIEAGDILEINNEKYEVIYDESYEKLGILIPDRKQLVIRHSALEYIFKKYKISIVTKERFNSIKYEVGE